MDGPLGPLTIFIIRKIESNLVDFEMNFKIYIFFLPFENLFD